MRAANYASPGGKVKTQGQSEITRPEAVEALIRSGYLIESRVERVLTGAGYYVEANDTFPDPESGKSRELDLSAVAGRKAGPLEFDFIWTSLLIECVNNPQPLVLLTKTPLVPFMHHEDFKHAGLPVKFPETGEGWQSLPNYLGLETFHHYCKGRVATQFCSFKRKSGQQSEWMALHEDGQFDAFRKLTAVTRHEVDKFFGSWWFGPRENVAVTFFYPVLVVGGELLEAVAGRKSVKLVSRSHLQFRRSELHRRDVESFQIDVITEAYLPRFLEVVNGEMDRIARRLRRRHADVRVAIERIVRGARRLRSPEKIREAMSLRPR